jgi:hypothetical protein
MNNIIKDNWNIIEEKVIKPMYEDGSFPLTVADAITKELNQHIQLSNDEIEKTIDVLTKWYLKNAIIPDEDAMYFDKAMQVLEQQLNGGWIPISERWPDKSGYYLTTYREWTDGNYLLKYDTTSVKVLRYQDAIFRLPVCCDKQAEQDTHREVIAWQPLPEPWKGEEE